MTETKTSTTGFSSYRLGFLKDVDKVSTSNADIERLWVNKTFPLLHLDDFSQNWLEVRDDAGIFHDESGLLYRVEPRNHHASSRLRSILDDCDSSSNVYEAIVFAKIMHQNFMNVLESTNIPEENRRRRLVASFQLLPRRWSHISIKHDLHLYKETEDPVRLNLGAGIYSALAVSNHIRLLRLLPAMDRASSIHCTMEEIELHPDLQYEALSYTWGAPTPRRTITLNETPFSVTENLAAALRSLRHAHSTRIIWIDAICINQGDVQERNSQVAQMDLIYKKANRVVVWLGKETSTSSRVFDILGTCREWMRSGASPDLRDSTSLLNEFYGIQVPDVHLDPISATFFHESESLVKFMERPWWKRVWVLQEFVLAKEVIFVCGSRSIDLKYLQAALSLWASFCRRAPISQNTNSLGRGNRVRVSLMEKFNDTLPFFLLQQWSDCSRTNIVPTLPELLSLSRDLNATDARDRIFGVIGLMTKEEKQKLELAPCYEMSTRHVFVSVAKAFIETTHRLDVLFARPNRSRHLHGPKPYHEDILLPSWVPNWTDEYTISTSHDIGATQFSWYRTLQKFMTHEARRQDEDQPPASPDDAAQDLYKAGLDYDDHHLQPWWRFTDNNEVLHVRGIYVDSIVSVGHSMHTPLVTLRAYGDTYPPPEEIIIQSWKNLLTRLNMNATIYAPKGDSILDAFWRTVALDRTLNNRRNAYSLGRLPDVIDRDNCKEVFGWPYDWIFPPQDDRQETEMIEYLVSMNAKATVFNRLMIYCANLDFFVTSQGYIGVGHPDCEPGDKIVVLLGSPVPLILREFDGEHAFIGESYVHGIMDGEMLRDASGASRNPDDLQWFSLV